MIETAQNAANEFRLPAPPDGKFAREKQAFYRMLHELLPIYRDQFVAIHGEKVVDSGNDQLELALRVQRRIGPIPISVHRVAESPSICRSGVVRELNGQEKGT